MGKLTAAGVWGIKTPGKYYDQHGLILRVAPGGSKQWVWRGTIRGRRRDVGLGSVAYTTLAEARDIAYEYRKIARAGGDPTAERHLKGPVFQVQAKEGPMPQLVKKRRSGWAVLAAGALVASLFAVGAGPAAALDEDSEPNSTAATSACVGDANDDMMFSDVSEGHIFWGDISCLAYYGVTIGYGDGTFRPDADVSNGEMVRFMQRAAAAAGADAEAVVGDFAETGSDPVHRGDMALLIARLLVEATSEESPVDVKTNDDGTFAVDGVAADDWDYFADSRRLQNRVSDSAASALYELGVAKGTGMGDFSPEASVSRGEMAAFITRALAHTTARPAGVTIQSDGPGEVIVSVRDANFQPLANAPVDVFSADADRVGDVFNADGSCYKAILTGVAGNAEVCEIDALDAVTGLSGDFDPGAITVDVEAGGTTVWAWTGESGDEVEDGGEGLASINLTETAPVAAAAAKVTTDMAEVTTELAEGVARAHFGSTVTVTIQLVGDEASNRADAVPDPGGNSYTVTIRRDSHKNVVRDHTAVTAVTDVRAESKTTQVLKVDASGKATFEITASDPDPTDSNNADGDGSDPATNKIDGVWVTYKVTTATGDRDVDNSISVTDNNTEQTIAFSDARATLAGASVKPATAFLTRPISGSANNVVTVTVVDQYGDPIRGHLVKLESSRVPDRDRSSTFPVARRTDSSGSVRIGYTYTGAGSTERILAYTASDTTPIPGARADFYWAAPAAGPISGQVLAADLERNTLVIANTDDGPQLVVYDDNDQFEVGGALTGMAAFEEALAADADDERNPDRVAVSSYDPTDAGDVARFELIVV